MSRKVCARRGHRFAIILVRATGRYKFYCTRRFCDYTEER